MDRQQPDADEDEGEAVDRHQPDLEADERLHAGTGPTPPAARIIHELIREDGEAELERSIEALLWSAFGAGLSMGFSFFTMSIIKSGLPEAPWAKLVTATGYTLGFIIVVLGRQQLFTESTLTAVLPLLTRKDAKTALQTARLWGIVLVFNILGTFAFAWLISHDALFDTAERRLLSERQVLRADGLADARRRAGEAVADLLSHLRRRRRAVLAHHRRLGGGGVRRLRRPPRPRRIHHPLPFADADRQHHRRRLARRDPQPRASAQRTAGR